MDLPHLSRHDIEEQLVAFYGTGKAERVRTTAAGEFDVVPVRSELELRESLPPLQDAEARMAFLVPWSRGIPRAASRRSTSVHSRRTSSSDSRTRMRRRSSKSFSCERSDRSTPTRTNGRPGISSSGIRSLLCTAARPSRLRAADT